MDMKRKTGCLFYRKLSLKCQLLYIHFLIIELLYESNISTLVQAVLLNYHMLLLNAQF